MRRRRIVLFTLPLIPLLIVVLVVMKSPSCGCEPAISTPTIGAVDQADNPLVEKRQFMFMSNSDGDWDIYVMALADRSITNLTNNDADDGFAAYSDAGGLSMGYYDGSRMKLRALLPLCRC